MEQYIDLSIPDMGQTGDIELIEWKLPPGSFFKAGDELCDLLTDKASFTLEAPADGCLLTQLAQKGEKVRSGQIVGKVQLNLS